MDKIRQEVIKLQHKVKDFLDQPGHASAVRLKNEVQALEDDLQTSKSKYSIEDRIKRVEASLDAVQASQAMSQQHVGQLADAFEDIRMRVRSM